MKSNELSSKKQGEFDIDFIRQLTSCFYYGEGYQSDAPSIQIGDFVSNNRVVFWLSYDNEKISKCSANLLRYVGKSISINNIEEAKDIVLKFMASGFDALDANYGALKIGDNVDNVLNYRHYEDLNCFLIEKVNEKKKKIPFFYPINELFMDGFLKLTNDITLYGAGHIDDVFKELDLKAKIKIDISTLTAKDSRDFQGFEQFALRVYHRRHTGLLVVYAKSREDALYNMDCVFGALCSVISNPFRINCCDVHQWISYLDNKSMYMDSVRINMPSVMRIDINNLEKEKLIKIFNKPNKKLLSALSFIAHGWTHLERDRFINQVIALDALYGIDRENKAAIIRGVNRDANHIYDVENKVDLIYKFRNKFVHGEIPSLDKHTKYKNFILEHGQDPLQILDEVVRACVNNYNGLCKIKPTKLPELDYQI